ncbi:helix-turn-helix domain-containing protein [Pseudonocardia acidicola]|uniref:GAF domain-containing protein n=1 Tax=Pseudonocardia acidicola TaxID=2724939 RepID=A0ABX1SMN9_9PSEU|nr:helix-turn-helix domain-containing protein [Pseudonocardia acidicola]NMI01833.1 GAF domain-containing protein [Pseudonocardia acidicola]
MTSAEAADRWDPGPAAPPAEAQDRYRHSLAAFAEAGAEVIASGSLEDLLALVGRQLCELIGVKRCSSFLRRDDGRFQGVAGHSGGEDIGPAIRKLIAGTSEDTLTHETVAVRAPVLAADAQHDPRPVRRAMRFWRVRAILSVPLVVDGEVIGIVYVDDEDSEHEFTAADIQLAEMFARLAAVIVGQAVQTARLRRQAGQLARQCSVADYLAEVHSRLTGAVLAGADVAAVVDLLCELAGKPVILYDAGLEVRAWAAPAALKLGEAPGLRPGFQALPAVRRAVEELDVGRPSAIVPPQPAVGLSRRHLLCVLMVEGRRCGYLDVVEMGGALGPVDSKLAEHGATVLSLQLLSEQRQAEAEGQARDDFLADLLRGARDAGQLARRAPQFGVDLSEPHVLVRLCADGSPPDEGPGERPTPGRRNLVVRALAEALGVPEPAAVAVPGAMIVLLRLPRAAEAGLLDDLRRRLEAMVRGAGHPDRIPGVRVAVVSTVCRRAGDFAAAHRELREIDELARAFGWNRGVLAAADLGVFRLVINTDRVAEALRFAEDYLRPLHEHDRRTGGRLVDTLRAYVAATGQVRAAAEALGVHENTVRYRLARIREVGGRDVHDLDSLLAARLAFQVLDLASGTTPG